MTLYTITIQGQRQGQYVCPADQPLTHPLGQSRDAVIPGGCRQGGCGSCKVLVVNGKVRHGHLNSIVISSTEIEQGWVLACQCYPESDLLLQVGHVGL